MKKLTLFFVLLSQITFAQSDLLSKTIDQIEFQEDTLLAVYNWVTDNIKYDVKKAKNFKEGDYPKKQFKNKKERDAYYLKEVLRHHKGVCQDYSLLFDRIVKELGYPSYIISGYTKNHKGKLNTSIGHTWNAVYADGEWKLYDPTWGAGIVTDKGKFIKKYNAGFFDIDPQEIIADHMPFDPLWQLSKYPLSYREFEKNIQKDSTGPEFEFERMIREFMSKSEKEQLMDQLARSKSMGKGISLVHKWQRHMDKNIGTYDLVNQRDRIKEIQDRSHEAVDLFNDYIKAKNMRFRGEKYSVGKARKLLEESKQISNEVIESYESFDVRDREAKSFIAKSKKNSTRLLKKIEMEVEFLDRNF
jgi:hypothetical protein